MKQTQILVALVTTMVFCIPAARAQDQKAKETRSAPTSPASQLPPDQDANDGNRPAPEPAARGLLISNGSQDDGSDQVQPDTRPLSGAETPGFGSLTGVPRLFDVSLNLSEMVQSGISTTNLSSVTSFGGNAAIARTFSRSQLAFQYTGGGSFSTASSNFNQSYHYFDVSERLQWNRWGLLLRDDFVFSPQASFGGLYTGTAGLVGQSTLLPDLTPVLAPEQTILTGLARRISNTSVGEVDYSLSARTNLNFSGAYTLQHFLSAGYLDSNQLNGSVGYSHVLDGKNSMGLVYTYSRNSFTGMLNVFEAHLAQVSYGRQVTGRLAFHAGGGPQLIRLQNYGPSSGQRGAWSLSSSLSYQLSRATGSSLSYSHGVSPGSGVFLGAQSDTVTGALSHKFNRIWSGSLTGGYARSESLVPTGLSASLFANWYGGANMSRPLGRQIAISFSYGFQQQHSGAGTCPVLSCGTASSTTHVGSVSVGWHPLLVRPN